MSYYICPKCGALAPTVCDLPHVCQPTWSIPMPSNGWQCPRCSRIWGPTVTECRPCAEREELRKRFDVDCCEQICRETLTRAERAEAERDEMLALLRDSRDYLVTLDNRITHPCPLQDGCRKTWNAIDALLARAEEGKHGT